MRAVEPRSNERLPGRSFALGDLVLVMREDQIDAAGVDVERLAEVLHRHRRALDVPARAARADRGLPRGLARFRALPEREVPDVVLAVLVALDPFADAKLVGIDPGEPTVGRPRRDPEEQRAVVGAVSVTPILERPDERDDLVEVI